MQQRVIPLRVLITGGAGFIGGHVAIELKKRGYDVIVVDNLENAPMRNRLRSHGILIKELDLRESVEIPAADVIIHAAAYIDVSESFEKPFEYIVNNTAVTAKISKVALDNRSFLVYLSSASVYGDPIYLPVDEKHPRNPLSPYGLSKKLGEDVVEFYTGLGLRAAILRLFNVYGPCQSKAYAGVISRFIRAVRNSQPLIVFGDGSQTRDFIHVYDVAEFIYTVIDKQATGVFNVGSGKPASINELAEFILRLSNYKTRIVHHPPRPGDIKHSLADISKAKSLGWRPRVELAEGLRELLLSDECIDQ